MTIEAFLLFIAMLLMAGAFGLASRYVSGEPFKSIYGVMMLITLLSALAYIFSLLDITII